MRPDYLARMNATGAQHHLNHPEVGHRFGGTPYSDPVVWFKYQLPVMPASKKSLHQIYGRFLTFNATDSLGKKSGNEIGCERLL